MSSKCTWSLKDLRGSKGGDYQACFQPPRKEEGLKVEWVTKDEWFNQFCPHNQVFVKALKDVFRELASL